MIAFILKYWQYIAVLFFLVWAVVSYIASLDAAYKRGYDAAMTEVAIASAEADTATREKQEQIKTKTRKVTHEIRKKDGADELASPYLRSVLDKLRADD